MLSITFFTLHTVSCESKLGDCLLLLFFFNVRRILLFLLLFNSGGFRILLFNLGTIWLLLLRTKIFLFDDCRTETKVNQEGLQPEQQEWSSRAKQEETEPSSIKVEDEGGTITQEAEPLQALKFPVIRVPVKSEKYEDHSQSEENKREEPPSSSSSQHITTEDDGGSEGGSCLPPLADHCDTTFDMGDEHAKRAKTYRTDESHLTCPQCSKTFARKSSLKKHMMIHKGEKPYICSFCGKGFSQKVNMITHIRRHTGEKPYTCSMCDKSFYDCSGLVQHMRTHTGEKPFPCLVCGKSFRSKSALTRHVRTHTEEKVQLYGTRFELSYISPKVSEKLNNKQQARSSREEQQEPKVFHIQEEEMPEIPRFKEIEDDEEVGEGEYCGGSHADSLRVKMCKIEMLRALLNQRLSAAAEEIFVAFERMVKEYEEELSRTKKLNEQQRQQLDSFARQDVLRRADTSEEYVAPEQHHRSSGMKQEPPEPLPIKEEEHLQEFDFQVCSVIVKSEDNAVGKCQREKNRVEEPSGSGSGQHMTAEVDADHRRGSQAESLIASLSDNDVITSDAEYYEHSKEDMTRNTDNEPWKCSQCDKIFGHKMNLKRHMIIHTGEKPFSCSICGKRFTQNVHLTSHLRIHTDEKPYTCPDCGRSFKRRTHLTIHIRTHTGEKPFSCPACNKDFIDYSAMIKHKRTHTGEKPYSCSFCDKSFGASSTLVTHLRTHTGVKPFSCSICDKRFYDCSGLTHHMKTHTGEKPFSCSVCGKSFRENSLLTRHMKTHTGEKMFSCNACDQKFSSKYQRDKHVCAGEKSSSA
ncbi:uncharacterized protein LOC144017119 [Festucalex cinctus]